jgi:hypothetical protein
MKKQFLAIALLLSCVQVSKPNELAQYAPGLAAAGLAVYGINKASKWTGDENAPGFYTTIGNVAGTTGRGALMATNVGLVLGATRLLFPTTNDIIVPAAAFGGLYLAANRLLLGADQKNHPTNVKTGAAWALGGGIVAGIYKTNALPPFTQIVNGILGRPIGFYQL